jgi:tetratricopeptide (TPR) repeat protein
MNRVKPSANQPGLCLWTRGPIFLAGLATIAALGFPTKSSHATPPAESCQPLHPREETLMIVSSPYPGLLKHQNEVERALRNSDDGLRLLPISSSRRILEEESGRPLRLEALERARGLLRKAEARFRELDDQPALELIAEATALLSQAHQEEGGTELLAQAHLLAGAIYLARERSLAARTRFQRALDLDPDVAPSPERFAPGVLREIAAMRTNTEPNETGRVEITLSTPDVRAEVFLDGQPKGLTPVELDSVGAGRHLLRVATPGFLSHIESFDVRPRTSLTRSVTLQPDGEIAKLRELPAKLRSGGDFDDVFAVLANRADVRQVVLASIALSEERADDAGSQISVSLFSNSHSYGYAHTIAPLHLRQAWGQVANCNQSVLPTFHATPSLLGSTSARLPEPSPVPEPVPFWEQPVFWAVGSVVAIAVSGAVVFAATRGGPPEAVNVTLVPRP